MCVCVCEIIFDLAPKRERNEQDHEEICIFKISFYKYILKIQIFLLAYSF